MIRLRPFGFVRSCSVAALAAGSLALLAAAIRLDATGILLLLVATLSIGCGAILWMRWKLARLDEARQRGSDAVRQQSEQIYDLFSRAPSGYHSLDEAGTVLAMNDTELDWLGYSREEIVGKARFSDLVAPELRQAFLDHFERFKREGKARDLEFSLLCRDGTELPVRLSETAIYDADGRYLASRSTVFDATERRRAEQTARQLHAELEKRVRERTAELARSNADLLQKNQENEMFVYGVSHDLRSPLVNLEGFSNELLLACDELREIIAEAEVSEEFRRRSLTILDEDMKQSVRFIQSAVARLSNIIDALLRLSRAGRVEYQWQRVDAADVVGRIVEAMSVSIYDRAASLSVGQLPPVYGDPAAIEQVFANLIGNAVNYLDPKRPGVIEVGARPAEPDAGEEHPESGPLQWTYFVKDNGLGIPEAYQAKVFQALKRLHPQVAKGEGIGLALVRRIVERHGGKTWFTSEAGVGTTFYFTLPVHAPSAALGNFDDQQSQGSEEDDSGAISHSVSGGR